MRRKGGAAAARAPVVLDRRVKSESDAPTEPRRCSRCRGRMLFETGTVLERQSYWECLACGGMKYHQPFTSLDIPTAKQREPRRHGQRI